jgi:hypothetical protein
MGKDLTAELAVEIIKQQLALGLKHPSAGLIKEAVETAEGIINGLEDFYAARSVKPAAAAPAPAAPAVAPAPVVPPRAASPAKP